MRLIILLLIFSSMSPINSLLAQDKKAVDSLEQLLKRSNPKTRIDVLFELARNFFDIENQKALQYAMEAKQLAEKVGDSLQYVKTSRIAGQLLWRADKLIEAIHILKEVEPIALRRGYKDDYKKILNALAISYTFVADYADALRYNFKSLSLRELTGDKAEISIALNNIGTLYADLGNYEKASEYFNKSWRLKNEIKTTYDLDRLIINIATCANYISTPQNARKYVEKGLTICSPACSGTIRAEAYGAVASSYYSESKFDSASKYFSESYEFAKNSNKRLALEALLFLVRCYNAMHHYQRSEELLNEAKVLALHTKQSSFIVDIYFEQVQEYIRKGDFKNATYGYQKYIAKKDSVFNKKLMQNLMGLQAEHEQLENKAKIDSQNKMLILKEEALADQVKLNVMTGVIAVLLLALVGLLYANNRQRKRTNNQLEEKVRERTRDLESSYQTLQQIHSSQNYFVHKTSDDLRSPLMRLRGVCSLASKEYPPASEYITKIELIGEELVAISNRLATDDHAR